jgi:hypothetical protein
MSGTLKGASCCSANIFTTQNDPLVWGEPTGVPPKFYRWLEHTNERPKGHTDWITGSGLGWLLADARIEEVV